METVPTCLIINNDTGEKHELKNCNAGTIKIKSSSTEANNFEERDIKIPVERSGSFTAYYIADYYPNYKEFKRKYKWQKLKKSMFIKDKHGFPIITIRCNGQKFGTYRGRNAIHFIRWFNKFAHKYNSRLHNMYIKERLRHR